MGIWTNSTVDLVSESIEEKENQSFVLSSPASVSYWLQAGGVRGSKGRGFPRKWKFSGEGRAPGWMPLPDEGVLGVAPIGSSKPV